MLATSGVFFNAQRSDDMQRFGTAEQIRAWQKQDAEDYRFYTKMLRVLYNKPKLKSKILKILKEIEDRQYAKVPLAR